MSELNREAEIGSAREDGARWDGSEWVFPNKKAKKKKMAGKMKKAFETHGKVMDIMTKSLRKNRHSWFKEGQGGSGDLPPGHTDKDNE